MSFCSPVLDTAWAWGTCGVFRTSATVMEEVSPCKSVSCFVKSQRAHRALVSELSERVSMVICCTNWGKRLTQSCLWVCAALQKPQAPRKLKLKAAANPPTKIERALVVIKTCRRVDA